jgi:hypothetical protein
MQEMDIEVALGRGQCRIEKDRLHAAEMTLLFAEKWL